MIERADAMAAAARKVLELALPSIDDGDQGNFGEWDSVCFDVWRDRLMELARLTMSDDDIAALVNA